MWRKDRLMMCCAIAAGMAASGMETTIMPLPGKQVELCMVGDSITWAEEGDAWRKFLLREMPELAFAGTHSGKYGYSHAGEGGNTTAKVLARIDSVDSVPDCRYYHLLIGVNDNASAKSHEGAMEQAHKTVDAIAEIVRRLEARPCAEKIFLGTLLPCANPDDPEAMKFRDLANRETNKILRAEFDTLFPGGKVVLVEYEKPLRQLPEWRTVIARHPSGEGYEILAGILAGVLRKETAPTTVLAAEHYGVEVHNLWCDQQKCTPPLIPGWYVVSFYVDAGAGREIKFSLESSSPDSIETPFKQEFAVRADSGGRVEAEFFTGYQGFGYEPCSITLKSADSGIHNILIEKMRPLRKASIYGSGRYVDSVTPAQPGEMLIPAP